MAEDTNTTNSPVVVCRMCRERYQGRRPEGFGSDPACAFPNGGPFTADNW